MGSYIELCLDTESTGDSNTSHPVVRIEMPMPVQSLDTVIDNLIRPALLASGYTEGSLGDTFERD